MRGGRRLSSLTRRLLAINLVPLALFLAGILYLDTYREGLLAAKIASLTSRGAMIAAALAETAVVAGRPDATGTPGHLPLEGAGAGQGALGTAPLDLHVMEERARQLLARLSAPSAVRTRLFLADGRLIADSRELPGTGGLLQAEALPPPGEVHALERWRLGLERAAFGLAPVFGRFDPYLEPARQSAADWPELGAAMAGGSAHALRDAGREGFVLTVAVPVSRYRRVQGALLLSTTLADVEAELRALRGDILALALIAFAATVALSAWLAGTIARPLKRLARAADEVRRAPARPGAIPDLGGRGDEIGELSRALVAMTGALERRMTATERFAADVAHEIKNPLASLKGALELLPRAWGDAGRRRTLLAAAAADLNRIDRLIGDVSDASRLDAELGRAPARPVDVAALLETMALALETAWGEDGPRLRLALEDGALTVMGIEDRLAQVVRNLLDNAASFSPAGGQVTLSAARRGAWVEIAVADRGPGIAAGKEEAIFERFYSDRPAGEAGAPARHGGHSGLGLAISRQIVEAHGGRLVARNLAAGGTRFTATLPAA